MYESKRANKRLPKSRAPSQSVSSGVSSSAINARRSRGGGDWLSSSMNSARRCSRINVLANNWGAPAIASAKAKAKPTDALSIRQLDPRTSRPTSPVREAIKV